MDDWKLRADAVVRLKKDVKMFVSLCSERVYTATVYVMGVGNLWKCGLRKVICGIEIAEDC